MKEKLLVVALMVGLFAPLSAFIGKAQNRVAENSSPREVAVTFDDLPSPQCYDVATLRDLTSKLLKSITSSQVPVIGFVNESKLHQGNELSARTAILKMWLDAGVELGNHTYSHLRLYNTPLDKFQEDVIRGETVTKKLLAERGMKLRYFRHPTLNTGPNLETKHAFEKF